ncbi:MAG: hypothetical protein NVSMB4_04110 [Acidimicrobiales bacterium]
MADLCVALCLLGWLIPVGGLLIALAVIPMAALSARNRLRAVLVAAIAGITTSFLVIGTGLALNVAVCAGVGAVVGIAVERGWSRTRTVASAVVALGLPATSLSVGVLALLGDLRRLTLVQLTNGWRGVARLLQRSGFADGARAGDHVVAWLVHHWPLAMASTILGVLAGTTWLAYGLTKPTLARLLGAVPGPLVFPPDGLGVPGPVPVRLEGVRYRYPGRDRDALDGVDLSLDTGRFVAVVGRNGSGKSTLGRVLAGLPISGGRLTRPGTTALGRSGGTAVVFQRPETQVLGVTAADDVVWGLPASQRPDVTALLGRVGLGGFAARETSTLSGGELQRLALAAALARQPALLIADEATAMVDPDGRTEIVDVLRAAADDGVTVVHVTHRLAETDQADVVVHMEDGHLGVGKPPLEASRSTASVPPPGPTILRLAGVGHTYGAGTPWAHRALCDVDLELRQGEGVLILGRNGSGKSTLAWILAGLLVPSEGAADLGGIPVASKVGAVGLSFQHARLQLLRPTVGEDVRAASGADVADVEASLRLVGLEPTLFTDRPVDQLSGGEQRRAALAGLLAGRPEVIVLDEPFAGLDTESRRDLADTLGGLRAQTRVTLIVVSHDTEGLEGVTDRVVHLEAGRVVADSAPSAVPVGPGQRAGGATRGRPSGPPTGRRKAELHLLRVVPGSSAVHRLWAGTKLVCLVVLALTLSIHPSWMAVAMMGGVTAVGIGVAGIPRGAVPRLPRWFWIAMGSGAVLTAVAGGPPDVHIAGSVLGVGALGDWARVTALAVVVIAAAALVSWTTPVGEVAPAVSRLGRPLRACGFPVDEWSTAIGLSFRCLPLLLDEIRTLGAVLRLRRAHTRPDPSQPRRARLHRLLDEPMGLLLAALVVALRRAGELASAIDARGGLGMTSADHRRPAAADAVTIGVVALAVVAALMG